MDTTEVLAIAYNRGLRPTVESDLTGKRLVWHGGKLTPAFERVVQDPVHAARLIELVEAGFTPETATEKPKLGVTTGEVIRNHFKDGTDFYPDRVEPLCGVPEFDHGAEAALRSLYAVGAGLIPIICVNSEPCIRWECRVGCRYDRQAAMNQVAAIAPLKSRVMAHIQSRPSGEWGGEKYDRFDANSGWLSLEWRVRGYEDGHHLRIWRQMYHTREVRHPFCILPSPRYDAWRWHGETHWRALWGRFETEDDGVKLTFVLWGI